MFGITFLAPEGVSQRNRRPRQPTWANLIRQIRNNKAAAIFVENISDQRLIEQIGRETGMKVGGELYSDALSGRRRPGCHVHRNDALQRRLCCRAAMLGS